MQINKIKPPHPSNLSHPPLTTAAAPSGSQEEEEGVEEGREAAVGDGAVEKGAQKARVESDQPRRRRKI